MEARAVVPAQPRGPNFYMILLFLIKLSMKFPILKVPIFLSIGCVGGYVKSIMDVNGPYLWVLILYQQTYE